MTMESNYAITIATLSDWPKYFAPVFQPMTSKTKTVPMAPCTRDFSHTLSKFQAIALNSEWFIASFAPVVIGRINYFGNGFSTSQLNTALRVF